MYVLNIDHRGGRQGIKLEASAETFGQMSMALISHYEQNHPHLNFDSYEPTKQENGDVLCKCKLFTQAGREIVDQVIFQKLPSE